MLGFDALAKLALAGTPGRAAAEVGEVAATLADLGLNATAALDNAGAFSSALDSLALTALGALEVQATSATAFDDIGFTSTGVLGIAGTVTATLGGLTCTSSAFIDLAGVLTKTLDPIGLSGSGTISLVGELDLELGIESRYRVRAPRAVLALGVEQQTRTSIGAGFTAHGELYIAAQAPILLGDATLAAQAYFGGYVFEPTQALVQDATHYAAVVTTPQGFQSLVANATKHTNLVVTPPSRTALVQDAAKFTEPTRPGW